MSAAAAGLEARVAHLEQMMDEALARVQRAEWERDQYEQALRMVRAAADSAVIGGVSELV